MFDQIKQTIIKFSESPATSTVLDMTYTTAQALRLCAFSAAFINYYKGLPSEEDEAFRIALLVLPVFLSWGMFDRILHEQHERKNLKDDTHDDYYDLRSFIPWILARGFKSYALAINWPRFIFIAMTLHVNPSEHTWKGINGGLASLACIPVLWDLSQIYKHHYTENPIREHVATKAFRGIRDVNVFVNSIFYFAEFIHHPIFELGFRNGLITSASIFVAATILAGLRGIYFSANKTVDYVRQYLSGFTMYMSLTSAADLLEQYQVNIFDGVDPNQYLLGLKILTVSFAFGIAAYHQWQLFNIKLEKEITFALPTATTACGKVQNALRYCFLGASTTRVEGAAPLLTAVGSGINYSGLPTSQC